MQYNVTDNPVNFNASSLQPSLNVSLDCDQTPNISGSFKVLVYTMYGIIMLLALLGNGLVCYIVCSCVRMKTVTNFFIVNLSVGDILMASLCIPFSSLSTLVYGYWPFGTILCHTVTFSQAVSVFVSVYVMVAISVDRYIGIIYPLRPRMAHRHAKVLVAVVWLGAISTSLPIAVVSKLQLPDADWFENCTHYICQEDWHPYKRRQQYTVTLMVLQYLVPLLVLLFTYGRIGKVVWGKRMPGEAENLRDQRMARSKRKMIKMMVIVVIVFTVCWLPYNIVLLLIDYHKPILEWSGMRTLYFACHWLAMSHSCYNPAIYCWMNGRFRNGYRTALSKVPGLRTLMLRVPPARDDSLHRVNTSTTTTSVRARNSVNRNSELLVWRNSQPHRFTHIDNELEEQI